MAFSDARKELDCSICLNIYTNPVTLRCGHNFCQECIEDVLGTQEGSGVYCCPECREESQERPELIRNITLRNIMESVRSTEPEKNESQIFCTQCIHSPAPAVKSCLLCEASLCDDHLRIHSKSSQHVLYDLTTPQKNRKCSVHEKILEYYCTEDSACLCGSCRLHGDHQGHQVEALEEASEKRKENLTNALQKLVEKREEMEESIKSLQKYKRKVQDGADGVTKRVTAIFRDIRRQLDILERRVLKEITMKAERVSFPPSDLIQDLEIKDDLSMKIRHIEEICNMTDPLTFLQESDTGDLCDTEDEDEEDKERRDKLLHGGGGLDVIGISHTLHTGLFDIVTGVNRWIVPPKPADIILDEETAHNNVDILDDRKTARTVARIINRPVTPKRFIGMVKQVLSSQYFSSGRHYWDVDVRGSSHWRVGFCYSNIDRTQNCSDIGSNYQSWCLEGKSNQLSVKYGNNSTILDRNFLVAKVRINLDYEAGQISFYELGIPFQHLHTFTATFNAPMHAALYLGEGCIKICRENQQV